MVDRSALLRSKKPRWRGTNSISNFDHDNINEGAVYCKHMTSQAEALCVKSSLYEISMRRTGTFVSTNASKVSLMWPNWVLQLFTSHASPPHPKPTPLPTDNMCQLAPLLHFRPEHEELHLRVLSLASLCPPHFSHVAFKIFVSRISMTTPLFSRGI
jgi:hypothetical protein